jgi:hypothetical protein
MFNDEVMDKVLKKCKENPEYLRAFEKFMHWSQTAPNVGMTVEEMASICMMGYAIGEDPSLQEMIANMLKISKLGLDIKDE